MGQQLVLVAILILTTPTRVFTGALSVCLFLILARQWMWRRQSLLFSPPPLKYSVYCLLCATPEDGGLELLSLMSVCGCARRVRTHKCMCVFSVAWCDVTWRAACVRSVLHGVTLHVWVVLQDQQAVYLEQYVGYLQSQTNHQRVRYLLSIITKLTATGVLPSRCAGHMVGGGGRRWEGVGGDGRGWEGEVFSS